MSSHAGHVAMETVYGQMLALQLGDGDEHHTLELDTTGLNVKGNLYLYLTPAPTAYPVPPLYCPIISLPCPAACSSSSIVTAAISATASVPPPPPLLPSLQMVAVASIPAA